MENKISIIIPVYNVDRYLSKCIDSVILQKYENWELILVNDGSTDNSVLINGMDSRVKSLLSQIGLSDRGINSVNDINIENMFNVDYQYADGQIARLRAESLDYIDNSLKLICKE